MIGSLYATLWSHLLNERVAIITDDRVKTLVAENLQKRLEERGFATHLFTIPPGEESKTREWKERIEDQMLRAGLGRDTTVIAVGGGVVCDLGGFVAATYCRGLSLILIPTTLLAQVDASLGGKVAVNVAGAKNFIGAFYPPDLTLIDPALLSTLPEEEIRNGVSEVVKYALIASPSLFTALQNKKPISEMIDEACSIKMEIVQRDPFERGERRVLNFGHTIGHAIESALSYRIRHGEAIAIGMVAEGYLSYKLGYLGEDELLAIHSLFHNLGFSLDWERKKLAMHLDKKGRGGKPRFVLLEKIGKPLSFDGAYCTSVDPTLVEEALVWKP